MRSIIVGAGQVGFHIANRLATENKDVVVIDNDAEAVRRVADQIDVQVIHGSGSDPTVLQEAGVAEADMLLAVTNSDEINLVACMAADLISTKTKKLARLRNPSYEPFHESFRRLPPHIEKVINPEVEVVKTIDGLISVPDAVDLRDFANGRVKLIGIILEPGSHLAGHRLADLPRSEGKKRILIVAIVRDDALIIPQGADTLEAGDIIYFVSDQGDLTANLEAFGIDPKPVKRVMIIGGGRIALRLAATLRDRNIRTKIIEKNADRCKTLAAELEHVVVLHGDGTDQDLLIEENVREMDVTVSLTEDEQTNIMASLLTRRLGVDRTITKVNKFSYLSMMSTIGINRVVSPHLSAVNSILHHMRKGRILSATSIKGAQGEILETLALESSTFVGKPLKDLKMPKGSLITCIIRGDQTIIPAGDSIILPGDRIFIFSLRPTIPKIEKILTVHLDGP